MSSEQEQDRVTHGEPSTTYREALDDVLFPQLYAVVAVFFAIPTIVYIGVLIHVYVMPVFPFSIEEAISKNPMYAYWFNIAAYGVVSVVLAVKYARESNA